MTFFGADLRQLSSFKTPAVRVKNAKRLSPQQIGQLWQSPRMALHMPLITMFPPACRRVVTSSNQMFEYRFWYGGNGLRAVCGLRT